MGLPMNAFVYPTLCLFLLCFIYDASGLEQVHQLNFPPSAILPSVPRFPSYEEFLDPIAESSTESNLLFLKNPRASSNMMLANGGDFGEEGCNHLNGMPYDGKMETTIEETYWMLYMASSTTEQINLDAVACVDRCVNDYCKAIKSKFTFADTGSYVQDLWGTDGQYLIYVKQTIVVESQKIYIFRSKVEDIQRGFINDQTDLSPVGKKDALVQVLQGSSFVILGANFEQFIVFETCTKSNPVVFVYIKEDLYLQNDDQKKQMLHDIDVILYNHKIDARKLKFFKEKFPDNSRVVGLGIGNNVRFGANKLNNVFS